MLSRSHLQILIFAFGLLPYLHSLPARPLLKAPFLRDGGWLR